MQEVASAAAAAVTDAVLQTDIKIIGRAYALQAAQFDSFYRHFVEALDAVSRGQPIAWDAAKFLADGHFKFFAAFARDIQHDIFILHKNALFLRKIEYPT